MKRMMLVIISALVISGLAMAGDAEAQQRSLLGERHVSDRSERDTIMVGKSEGKFRTIQFKVTGAPVEFKRIVVHFEDGSEQRFEKNRLLGQGSKSRNIDLQGGARFIEKIVFHYEARSRGWKGAYIKVWGKR